MFDIKTKIYFRNPSGAVNKIYDSLFENSKIMYLNIYENQLSFITDLKKFFKKYQCEKCTKPFRKEWNLKRHISICYEKKTKYIFPGGFH